MSKTRATFLVFSLIVAAVGSYFGGHLLVQNGDAYEFFGTILTVFAGFLFAVLSVLGDPSLIQAGTWRKAELDRNKLNYELIRIGYLFAIYLLALACLGISVLVNSSVLVQISETQLWMGRATVFFSTLALILTFPLPIQISRIQMWRYDNEIEKRKNQKESK